MNIEEKNIPVIFFHEGNQEYLKYAILSAEKYNKTVILLGDKSNKKFSKLFDYQEKYISDKYFKFTKYYKHMSTNGIDFEINCFKRYFILNEFMKKNDYRKSILLDSDVLTYVNYSSIKYFNECYAALSIPKKQEDYIWACSPHCSCWTIEALDDFITFILEIYKNNIKKLREKYDFHLKNHIKGGICDMTLLYLWSMNKRLIYNCAKEIEGNTFDHSINISTNYLQDEYKMSKLLRIKKVEFINNIPYFIKKDGKKIKTYIIHCQGSAKMIMKDYYDQKFDFLIFHRYGLLVKKFIQRYLKFKKS